jgi:magnesium-transporting ATPase (P-type)
MKIFNNKKYRITNPIMSIIGILSTITALTIYFTGALFWGIQDELFDIGLPHVHSTPIIFFLFCIFTAIAGFARWRWYLIFLIVLTPGLFYSSLVTTMNFLGDFMPDNPGNDQMYILLNGAKLIIALLSVIGILAWREEAGDT